MGEWVLSRDFPDASDLMHIFALCPPSCKTEARSGRLPSHWAIRMRVERLIWVFSLAATTAGFCRGRPAGTRP